MAQRRYLLLVSGLIIAMVLTIGCARLERQGQAAGSLPPSEAAYPAGDTIEELVSSGQTRHYRLHIPPSYQPGQPMPLVINIHGLNSNAGQQERVSAMSLKADQAGFIVVYPEGRGNPQQWAIGPGAEGQEELRFFHDLLDHLANQLSLDPARIYVTGISNGAQMTHRLGCEMGDQIAAIAPVSGGYFRVEKCRPGRPLPIVAFHGTADNLLPYGGQGQVLLPVPEWAATWAKRNGCQPTSTVTFQHGQVTGETWGNCQQGADVVLYTIEGGGHSWPGSDIMPSRITTQDIEATDVIWDFFAAHPKP